jgi:TonB family protein
MARSQNLSDVVLKDTTYISILGKEVTTRDSADYLRVLKASDSGYVNVREYYLNGNIKSILKSSTSDKMTPVGPELTFYPDGKKESILNYNTGTLNGSCYYYYHNGTLKEVREYGNISAAGKWFNSPAGYYLLTKYQDSTGKVMVTDGNGFLKETYFVRGEVISEGNVIKGKKEGEWKIYDKHGDFNSAEKFKDGQLLEGECSLKGGKTYKYYDYEVEPQFPGGETEFLRYVYQNVKYPQKDKKIGFEGKVIVSFVVNSLGQIKDVKITHSADADMDKAVIQVIKDSPLWQPGIRNGIPVNVLYTFPVTFALKNKISTDFDE